MRREFLKGYVLCLISEGRLRATDSPSTMVAKVIACVSEDAAAVAAELAALAVQQGAQHFGSFLRTKVEGFARDLTEGGFGKFWSGVMANYDRGAEASRKK